MNELREALERELAGVQASPHALAAIRRTAATRRSRRPWLLVAGALVPIGAAAAIAAVLLTGPTHTTGTTNPAAVGVIQQSSPTASPAGASGSAAASPAASATDSAAPGLAVPIRVRAVQAEGYRVLTGTVPQVGFVADSAAGPGPNAALDAEQAAIAATNTIITARISSLPVGAFGSADASGTVSTDILETGPHVVSVYVSTQTTTPVAAHPDDEIASFVVDLDTAAILDPNTFFTDETSALASLSTQAETLLRKQIPANEFLASGVAPTLKNFQNLTPTAAGLRVDFAYYQVGPRPVNAPHVVIPWSVVDPLLTPATARLFGR